MMIVHLIRVFYRYLLPFPGRAALTWRIALLSALMAVVAMIYEIPESAISCYLIIYLMKDDANENIVIAIAVSILLSLAVALIFLLTNLTINSVFFRIFMIFICSYFFVYMGAKFNVSEIGNLVALVIAFLLTLLSDAPTGELATRAILYALLMATTPMLLMIIFNLILGKKSQNILLEKFSLRLKTAQNTLMQPIINNKFGLKKLLRDSQGGGDIHLKLIKIFHLQTQKQIEWLENVNKQTLKLLALVSILPKDTTEESRKILANNCQYALNSISDKSFGSDIIMLNDNLISKEICNSLNMLVHNPVSIAEMAPKLPKQKKRNTNNTTNGTLTYHYFAFKVTISALICYGIYTLFDWQGIHTAMITCYVVALGTTAETIHKLTLRILGCLVGALIGVLSTIYVTPHLDSINGLFLLIFIGMLLPAWITAGSELFSYAGVQIGLAFLLTVLNGFSPSTDLVAAQDRILGVLLGIAVCFVVFTVLWPVSISDTIYQKLSKILNLALDSVQSETQGQLDIVNFAQLIDEANQIDYNLKLVIFDTKLMKLSNYELKTVRYFILQIIRLNTLLILPIDSAKRQIYQNELTLFLSNNVINRENIAKLDKLNELLRRNINSILKDI
ncbi:FUSC family protein [Orbus sturtevantii]|uniref:FUSC family protein n=1 Tax=Orbus sturtevantii TaxID=3074109 RepID=UPI00370D851C